jgi:hypothetical protein
MAAASTAAAALEDEDELAVPRTTRARDGIRQAIITTPAKDGHVHCALFVGDTGDGFTSPAKDGHQHEVRGLEIMIANGHRHDTSARRCTERHDRHTGQHVQTRR